MRERKLTLRKIEIKSNVLEEGIHGVRDLNMILLIRIRDVDIVHSLFYAFHCSLSLSLSLSLALAQQKTLTIF